MSISAPFISRPVGTALLTMAVALVGAVAYLLLSVSPLPQVDFPTIRVQASLPGASPETMAATVATPLERALGRIAGVDEMTSQSSMGTVSIILQFSLARNIDGAARDVQAAINAARSTMPTLPSNPTYRKLNPADMPIMVLALTSTTRSGQDLYDLASSVLSQKIAQLDGVGQVQTGGGSLPAVRVELEPGKLNRQNLSLDTVRTALARANANLPKGLVDDGETQWFIGANDQLRKAKDFAPLIVRHSKGVSVRLADIGEVHDGVQDTRNAGFANAKPSVLLIIYRQSGSNIIETVQRIKDSLPLLRAWVPEDTDFIITMDRSPSITASLREVEKTLVIAMVLVVLVVFIFLRNSRAILIPAVAVPVSLLGTFGIMYLLGFSLNHLSLMALTVATGFVVDDAIVVTENIVRHIEDGMSPLKAAYLGSREVAFTVMSITLSLVAIFIPILCMGGLLGRLFKEFAVTLSVAVLVSLLVSLVTTPMMCSQILRQVPPPSDTPERHSKTTGLSSSRLWQGMRAVAAYFLQLGRAWGKGMDAMHKGYARSLAVVLQHKRITLLALFLTIGFNIYLYVIVPKGFFPQQDTGQIFGMIQADQSISFQSMREKLLALMRIVQSHPDVATIGGFTGGGQRNSGMTFIALKPADMRTRSTEQVIADLRKSLSQVPGAVLRLQPLQDLAAGGRRAAGLYQFTLQSDELGPLREWTPRILEAIKGIPGVLDSNSDQESRGLQTSVQVDKNTMARLGLTQKQVDTALGLAFGQSFASTIYTAANQYRVIMEFAPNYLENQENLQELYVPKGSPPVAAGPNSLQNPPAAQLAPQQGPLVPLLAFSAVSTTLTPLAISHQGQFTAATISFNLAPGVSLPQVEAQIRERMFALGVPSSVQGNFQGTAKLFASGLSNQPLLILAALVTLYIVLGVLYESLIHPLTILSTLPSAGVGAILGLMLFGSEFSIIAFIGVLLLGGIVKKNAILMIDFAIAARRNEGLNAEAAIYKACILRFRPIMMTTMAAVFGAVPLLLARSSGAELRTPLGITIVGGLLVSQVLTLYTTPVVYLYLDRFTKEGRTERLALQNHY